MKAVADARKAMQHHPLVIRDSNWARGVYKYAEELFNSLLILRNIKSEETSIDFVARTELMRDAKNWYEYSLNSYALTDSYAIRDRLSPTSNVKDPSINWFYVQAEALDRAAHIVAYAVNNRFPNEKRIEGRTKVKHVTY